jgi:predicted lipoprotein
MVNRSKQKGTAWETRIVRYLVENGFPYAERRALSGKDDRGDINIPGIVIEAKNQKQISLATWIDEMVKEKANAGVNIGVVVFPRRNHSIAKAYCVMQFDQFVELVK